MYTKQKLQSYREVEWIIFWFGTFTLVEPQLAHATSRKSKVNCTSQMEA